MCLNIPKREIRLMHASPLLCALAAALLATGARAETFDVIVRGGTVFDGTGDPRYAADVGVRGGRIARVGDLSTDTAPLEVDARGLFVAPGFINIHSHPEPDAVARAENVLTQGITTEIGNPDGMGGTRNPGVTDLDLQFKTTAASGLAANLGFYIGFNVIWAEVVGPADRRATETEIARMRALVDRGLRAGAWGISAGLDYKPAYFADTDEVVRVVSAGRPWRTNFPNHERLAPETDYRGMVGMRETVEIAVKAGLAPVITHMKSQGAEQQRSQDILDLMDGTARAGRYTAGDLYPYTAGFNNVRTLLIPAWAVEGGEDALYARFKDPATRARLVADIERIMALRFNGPKGVYVLAPVARELTDLAADWKVSPGEAVIRLNEQYRGRLPETYLRHGAEEDVVRMLRHPAVAVACDCGSLTPLSGHPRAFGAFPRVLGRYVRELGVLSWEEAIRKMSGLPASIIGMVDRGFIAPGMAADIVVFDPRTVIDRATFERPALSEGIRDVLVNGRLALKGGQVTGIQGGEAVRRSANMPTRPFDLSGFRRVAGAAVLDDGTRLELDLSQGPGRRGATGRLALRDGAGRAVFVSDTLGLLQTAPDWASITGYGSLPGGERRAFTLIVDAAAPALTQGRGVVLSVEAQPVRSASRVKGVTLARVPPKAPKQRPFPPPAQAQ
jgi:N-acyl-D-aspartate/D-glutamate deacylase